MFVVLPLRSNIPHDGSYLSRIEVVIIRAGSPSNLLVFDNVQKEV